MEEEDIIQPPSRSVRVVRAFIACIVVFGLVYLSGIHQSLLLQKTPDTAQQEPLPSRIEAEEIRIPITVYVLTGPLGSFRTESNIRRLIENANNVWSQARVTFTIEDIVHISVSYEDVVMFERTPYTFIEQSGTYDPDTIAIYLARTLRGVNGLAYGGAQTVSVADYTSSMDYRTLAHEFGHILGLNHVTRLRALMVSGGVGVELSEEEIHTAREYAHRMFGE